MEKLKYESNYMDLLKCECLLKYNISLYPTFFSFIGFFKGLCKIVFLFFYDMKNPYKINPLFFSENAVTRGPNTYPIQTNTFLVYSDVYKKQRTNIYKLAKEGRLEAFNNKLNTYLFKKARTIFEDMGENQ